MSVTVTTVSASSSGVAEGAVDNPIPIDKAAYATGVEGPHIEATSHSHLMTIQSVHLTANTPPLTDLLVFRLWEEVTVPGEKPPTRTENM